MSETKEHISQILSIIPSSPGIYQYFDNSNTIIYVGKAKNLKNRVRSYFNSNKQHNSKQKYLLVKLKTLNMLLHLPNMMLFYWKIH